MDAQSIFQSLGYAGIFLSVFIECGVPLGLIVPLPGYSLLFAAGVLCANGSLDIRVVIITGIIAAISGYIVGYIIGYKYGRKLFFGKHHKKYFTESQGRKTEKFMKRFGYLTLIFGRFLAFVHNLAPILGGFAKTPFWSFMIANVVGAIIWVFSAVFLGFYLGHTIPHAEYYIVALVIGLVIFSNTSQGKRLVKKVMAKIENI